ncbi:SPFH domain-containing protein [Streptomyces sp. NPDC051704]|uniref:SPFH domain-containing protein n=1 Tax=Streptomyces sp. NPDC051704 TaxID=3365671 RepID=UPI00379A76B4
MYPTRTTSTTGTFRVPPAPPQAPALRATGDLYAPALHSRPAPVEVPVETLTAAPVEVSPTAPIETRSEVQPGTWPEVQPGARSEARSEAWPEIRSEVQPGTRSEVQPGAWPEVQPEIRSEVQPGTRSEVQPEAWPKVQPEGRPEWADVPVGARPTAPLPVAAVIPAPSEAPAESLAAMPMPMPMPMPSSSATTTAHADRPRPEAGPSAVAPVPAPYAAHGGPESGAPADRVPGAAVPAPSETQAECGPEAVIAAAGAEHPVPRAAAGVPAVMVALPHGRPAAESSRSEVPAARIRVEPEPVHALAGAGDRAEYGPEPGQPLSVPAPAVHPHPAVPTLRLRAEPATPAGPGPGAEPPSDGPAHGYGAPAAPHAEAGPLTPRPHDEAGGEPAPQGGYRARLGQVWPAGPEAEGPAQRYGEPWPPAAQEGGAGSRTAHAGEPAAQVPYVPQPHDGIEAEVEAEAESGPRPTAVPGPAVGDIVARAVARGMAEGDAEDLPRIAEGRGAAVTEVPLHLPFPAESRPPGAPSPAPTRAPAPAARPRAARPEPGRRVPRGDERLREHRGPVLPGWVGVGVGALALSGCLAVLWRAGAVPAAFVAAFGATPRAYQGLRATHWPPLAFLGIVALLALGGLGRAKAGHAWVLTLFGRYRGTVRRTGLTWVSPLLLRRRVDVRLRHWRSEPMPAVDSGGLALRVVVQVVWQVKDTARATLAVEDHTEYLAEQVESAMARVLSQLPADAFHEDAPTLRDSEAVGDALTRMLATETEAVGIEVYSAQPTRIEYAPEVAEAMRRRRVAAIDAKHRDTVLTSVVDAVDDTVHRLTSRGLVELDDYERKALVKDLTVAFYTGRPE